ncbi:MAG: hypothetical protein ACLSHU_02030 [Oscillospiraceae bacterium]
MEAYEYRLRGLETLGACFLVGRVLTADEQNRTRPQSGSIETALGKADFLVPLDQPWYNKNNYVPGRPPSGRGREHRTMGLWDEASPSSFWPPG